MSSSHHLAFGLITDVQYADVEDGSNYYGTRKRYYRAALKSLQQAVSHWKDAPYQLACVVQLGDIIDGLNKRRFGKEVAESALKTALAPFKELDCPTYHMIGNHDLYNFTRAECLSSELNSSRLPGVEGVEGALYYSVLMHPRLKLVVLDTFDIGILGFSDCPDHPSFLEGEKVLELNNPNESKSIADGLEGAARRFAHFNGGVGKEQLGWLEAQLTSADAQKQNVLICGHVQLTLVTREIDVGTNLLWNYEDVLKIVNSHGCVVGCVMGHDHDGSLSVDSAGLQHLVLNGVIETPPDSHDFATAFLCDETLEVQGNGRVPSVSFPLRYFVHGGKNPGAGIQSC